MENLNIKVERVDAPIKVNIHSLCNINTNIVFHKQSLQVKTTLIKESIQINCSLVCSIGNYKPPVEPVKLKYPGIIEVFSNHESIFISWQKVEHASYYELILGNTTIITEYCNYTFTGLQENTKYIIYLRSKSSSFYYIDSDYTSKIVYTTEYSNVPIKLSAPILHNIITTPNSISIEWNKIYGAREYELSLGGENFIKLTSTHYEYYELNPNTTYAILLRSIGDGYYYQSSDYIINYITTNPSPYVLPSPEVLSYKATSSSILVKWKPVDVAINYRLYIEGTGMRDGNPYYTTNTEYLFGGLAPGNLYRIEIIAVANPIYNFDSKPTVVEIYSGPPIFLNFDESNITTIKADLDFIYIEWEKIENAVGYSLLLDYDYNTKVVTTDNHYTFTNLKEGTNYKIIIAALGDWIYSYDSRNVYLDVTTISHKVLRSPLVSYNIEGTNLYIEWKKVSNALKYELILNNVTIVTEELNYTFEELDPGDYTLQIRSLGDNRYYHDSEYSNYYITIEKPVEPEEPEYPIQLNTPIVEKLESTYNSLTLGWTIDPNATSYNIKLYYRYFNEEVACFNILLEDLILYDEGTKAKYYFDKLNYNKIYELKVKAIGDGVYYVDSSEVSFIASTDRLSKIDAVDADSIKIDTLEDGNIKISWGEVYGAYGYYWEIIPADGQSFANKFSEYEYKETFIYPKIEPETNYIFRIQTIPNTEYEYSSSDFTEVEFSTGKIEGFTLRIPTLEIDELLGGKIIVKFKPQRFATKYKFKLFEGSELIQEKEVKHLELYYLYCIFDNLNELTEYIIEMTAVGDGTIYYKDSHNSISFTTPNKIQLLPPTITLVESTADQIYISWKSSENTLKHRLELYKGDLILESLEVLTSSNNEYYFNNLEGDTEYTVIIWATGDSSSYKDSEHIYKTIKTKVAEIPVPPEPEDPDVGYLEVYPEIYYCNYNSTSFNYSVRTNRDWKFNFDTVPYLSVIPREKVFVGANYNTVQYKVRTNLFWNVTHNIKKPYVNVTPNSTQLVRNNYNVEYKVNSNVPWAIQYNMINAFDTLNPRDNDSILLDSNGEELLVKIT